MRVIIGISADNITLIQKYWSRMMIVFDSVRARSQQEPVMAPAGGSLSKNTRPMSVNEPEHNQISLNTRAKILLYSKEQNRFCCKLITISVLSMVLVVVELLIC